MATTADMARETPGFLVSAREVGAEEAAFAALGLSRLIVYGYAGSVVFEDQFGVADWAGARGRVS